MGLRVKIDTLGTTQRDFFTVKSELVVAEKQFDPATLKTIPYNLLPLAAIGTADSAMCDLKLVQEEKALRRERFLAMDEEELHRFKNFLTIERMWDDVIQERGMKLAPRWEDMTDRQRVWLKLNCVFSHVDDPHPRIGEVFGYLRSASLSGAIPSEFAYNVNGKLKDLCRLYPQRIEDGTFRDRIQAINMDVIQFLPEDERKAIENEQVQGYSCTSDCYRILLP